MKKFLFLMLVFSLFSFSVEKSNDISEYTIKVADEYNEIFNSINFGSYKPDLEVFKIAYNGYNSLKSEGKMAKNIITLIDFSISSNNERMWVIDLDKGEVLFHTLVAHGRNTGEEYAKYFSNEMSSYKSSLGFYLTNELYHGKHGLSLRLDGLEKGYNDKARDRAIVMHGANYVSKEFIAANGRLGRSLGCPAVPEDMNEQIIKTIQGKSLLFIYHPNQEYLAQSPVLKNSLNI